MAFIGCYVVKRLSHIARFERMASRRFVNLGFEIKPTKQSWNEWRYVESVERHSLVGSRGSAPLRVDQRLSQRSQPLSQSTLNPMVQSLPVAPIAFR